MGTNKATFAGIGPLRMTGSDGSHVTGIDVSHATGSDVSHATGSDVSHVTRSHVPSPEVCSAHAQPEVAPYPP